jgi:MoxR-like ATPase
MTHTAPTHLRQSDDLGSSQRVAADLTPPNGEPAPRAASLLPRLGLYGLDSIEPVVLAALATEEPLLVIGPHGTAKSLLLTRLADVLGLEWRHYNASLLSFDDLVGFPLPGPGGTLEYVRTPAAIWGAGAVIFDEISRCRPDIQNKLFPIIHERRAQGLLIEGLRYRWAAMNPPMLDDDEHGYVGSEPLDPALADRFMFIVAMPNWTDLSEDDQLAIIGATTIGAADTETSAVIESTIALIRSTIVALQPAVRSAVAQYARGLVALLGQAAMSLSPRRAGMIARGVVAVHAARLARDPRVTLADSAYVALTSALPGRAHGLIVADAKVLTAHREAWRLAHINEDDPLRAVLLAADPVERIRLSVAAPALSTGDTSRIVADALAQLPPGARDAAVVFLFESQAIGQLHAAVAEQAGERYASVLQPATFSESLHNVSPRFTTWRRIQQLLGALDPTLSRAHMCANAIAAAFARGELTTPDAADAAWAAWHTTDLRLSGDRR